MEKHINSSAPPNSARERPQPIILISQFMQQVPAMKHADEAFFWLAQAMVRYLDVSISQFLAIQQDASGSFYPELRAQASSTPMLSQIGYVGKQVTTAVDQVFREQQGILSRPVETIFVPAQASLYLRHNLRYWAAYLLQNDALLPPPQNEHAPGKAPVPLTMIVSLFTSSPLSTEQARAIQFLLEQVVRILTHRGLLITPQPLKQKEQTPEAQPQHTRASTYHTSNGLLANAQVITQRVENIEQFQADNPFANASVINDKQARRLYSAIDGRKDINALIEATNLDPREVLDALRYLFEQEKVRFYTAKGEPVRNPVFLSSL